MKKLLFNFLFFASVLLVNKYVQAHYSVNELQKGKLLYQNSLATENPGKIKGFYIKTLFWVETRARNGSIIQSKMEKRKTWILKQVKLSS